MPGTQPDRDVERRGPPLAHAFDDKGAPTRAALGFAKSIGVEVDRLVRLETGAGAWLAHRFTETGATLASLLPGMLARALERLPAPRRMRWADRDTEFVRPVHWVVLMHGGEVVEAEILGVRSGRVTRGHRFHHDFRRTGGIALEDAGRYEAALRDEGRVVAGFEARMEIIREQVEREAQALGGRALVDPELLEENTALVEWPVAVAGHFDAAFLALPDAVLTATMQGHQRYFPVAGDDGALMPHFIAVSNIASRDVETVRKGNERVIRPRLSDAAYFFDADRRRTLESRLEGLKDVVFQRKLGTLHAKAQRVSALAGRVAEAMGRSGRAAAGASALVTPTPATPTATRVPAIAGTADDESQHPNGRPTGEALAADALASHARRAGLLSKCDLLTEMVGEFPELQAGWAASTRAANGEPEGGGRRDRRGLHAALRGRRHPRHSGRARGGDRRQARHAGRHLRDRAGAERGQGPLRPAPRRPRGAAHHHRGRARPRSRRDDRSRVRGLRRRRSRKHTVARYGTPDLTPVRSRHRLPERKAA